MTNGKRGRKPKYLHIIILDGINAHKVSKEYKQNKKDTENPLVASTHFTPIIEYTTKIGTDLDQSTTQITDLATKKLSGQVFLDYLKDERSVTLIDYVNYGCLPERTDLCCFHCRHPFNTSPIGIPIKYIPEKPEKELEDNSTQIRNDYFLTYGVFCSFPCCLAFLKEHSSDQFFRNSKSLLYSLYFKLYNTELRISPAPSWECLKIHGGNLSIDEFRKSFCTCNYVITPNIKRPYMVTVGRYIQESRCGFL